MTAEHEQVKQKDQTPKASYGYGGKFGVEKDRMDKVARLNLCRHLLCIHCLNKLYADSVHSCICAVQVALGNDYVAQVEQHSSQKDAAQGFGGKFGVQKDRVDKVRRRESPLLSNICSDCYCFSLDVSFSLDDVCAEFNTRRQFSLHTSAERGMFLKSEFKMCNYKHDQS